MESKLKSADLELQVSQQRLLAVGLLVGVVLVIGLVIFLPLISKELDLLEAKKNLVFKLQQYERILANSDTVTNSMADISKKQEQQGYFNRQATDALASAEMQEFIKKTIVDAGGQLSSCLLYTSPSPRD